MNRNKLRQEIIYLYQQQAVDAKEEEWLYEAEQLADRLLHRIENNEYYAIEDLCYLYYCYDNEKTDFTHVFYWLDKAEEENRNQYEFNRKRLEKLKNNCRRLMTYRDFTAGKVEK